MKATFFETAAVFRGWLDANHDEEKEIWVGFYKLKSGRGGMVYREAIDEALCYGWIDGVLRSIDDESYGLRFTPRRKGSNWSAVNVERAKRLQADGRMRPAGLAAFERRDESKSRGYSFERQQVRFSRACERTLRANRKAWAFFSSQSPSYRRTVTWWVMSAKKDETRERRLASLVAKSQAGQRVY